VAEAQSELKKVENVRKVKEAEEKRKRDTIATEKKQKAEGTFVAPGAEDNDAEGGWNRASAKQPEVAPRREEPPTTIGRSGFGQSKPQEKPEEISRKPTFTRSGPKKEATGEDGGFMSRSQMGSEKPTAAPKKEEEKAKPIEST